MDGVPSSGSAIHVRGDHLPVPMQLFGRVSVVVYFDRCWLTFLETQ